MDQNSSNTAGVGQQAGDAIHDACGRVITEMISEHPHAAKIIAYAGAIIFCGFGLVKEVKLMAA